MPLKETARRLGGTTGSHGRHSPSWPISLASLGEFNLSHLSSGTTANPPPWRWLPLCATAVVVRWSIGCLRPWASWSPHSTPDETFYYRESYEVLTLTLHLRIQLLLPSIGRPSTSITRSSGLCGENTRTIAWLVTTTGTHRFLGWLGAHLFVDIGCFVSSSTAWNRQYLTK